MLRMFETPQHAQLYARYRPDPPASLIRRVLEHVGPSASRGRAVDVGCGTGQNSRLLAQHFASVLATDISPEQVTAAAATEPSGGVQYQTAPAERIPAEDGSVNLVTASMCYHYFGDKLKFLAEADRVLKPGGVIALYGYQEPYPRLEDGRVWTEFNNIINNVRDVHLKGQWRVPVRDLMSINREAVQLVGYPEASWDDASFFTERPLSIDDVLGEMSSWSGFQNLVSSQGAGRGEELMRRAREEMQALVEEGERSGINVAAATERRQCFLMLARKPAAEEPTGQ